MKKIDAHSHLGHFGVWADVNFTEKELLTQMEEYEVEKTILTGSSSAANDTVVEAYQKIPDKILPIVWVNPVLDNVQDKLDKYINKEGFKGVKMHPLFEGYVANDPCTYPIMDFAEENDIPVFIHCGHPPFSLPWSIALLAEKYPNVKVVMIHMGHGHGIYIQGAIECAQKYDNLYLEMSGMPMSSKIKEAYETVGSDRIMFGIDSPFHHPTVEIQKVLTSGLSEEEMEDVFYNNAKKLMGI